MSQVNEPSGPQPWNEQNAQQSVPGPDGSHAPGSHSYPAYGDQGLYQPPLQPNAEPSGYADRQLFEPQPVPPNGQQPAPTPYGRAGWGAAAPPAPRRPVWRTVLGWILIGLSVLLVLSTLSSLGRGGVRLGGSGAAYVYGYVVGTLLTIALPAVIGWLLLRRKK